MTSRTKKQLANHEGHRVEIAIYLDDNIVLECLDCQEILLEFRENDKGNLEIGVNEDEDN